MKETIYRHLLPFIVYKLAMVGLLLTTAFTGLVAQDATNLVGLKQVLGNAKDAFERADLINSIFYSDGYNGEGFEALAEEGIATAKSLNNDSLLTSLLLRTGYFKAVGGDMENGILYFQNSIEAGKLGLSKKPTAKVKDAILNRMMTAYHNLSVLYRDMGDLDKSASATLEGLELSDAEGAKPSASLLAAMANLYIRVMDLEKAESYFRQAINVANQPSHKNILLYQFAEVFLEKNQLDSALQYFDAAMQMALDRGDAYAFGLSSKGRARVALHKKEWDEAAQIAMKGIEKIEGKNLETLRSDLMIWAARAYISGGKVEKGLSLIKEVEEIEQTKNTTVLKYEVAEVLSSAYAQKGQYKDAYKYLLMRSEIMDSNYSVEKLKNYKTAETRYLLEKKEAEKLLLQEKNERQKRLNYLTLLALALALTIVGLLFFGNRRRRAFNEKQQVLLQQLEHTNTDLEKDNYLKQKLISIVSHNVSGPLKSIANVSQLLAGSVESLRPDYLRGKLQTVHSTANELTYLISNIMTWVKTQNREMTAVPETFDLKKLVDDTLLLYQSIASEKQVALISEVPETTLRTDRSMLGVCLQNLIHNALKYSEENGTITIKGQQSGGKYQLSVTDNGKGMNEDRLAQVQQSRTHFSVAGTKGETGYGLGLLIVREMMEKTGGRLVLESEVGKGTVATIEMQLGR